MKMLKMYRVGATTWRRGNPFLPFPFPDPLAYVRIALVRPVGTLRPDIRVALYPLWPWQKYFWVMPPDEVEYRWHLGPVFVVK